MQECMNSTELSSCDDASLSILVPMSRFYMDYTTEVKLASTPANTMCPVHVFPEQDVVK
jgi:hypothetical protein